MCNESSSSGENERSFSDTAIDLDKPFEVLGMSNKGSEALDQHGDVTDNTLLFVQASGKTEANNFSEYHKDLVGKFNDKFGEIGDIAPPTESELRDMFNKGYFEVNNHV